MISSCVIAEADIGKVRFAIFAEEFDIAFRHIFQSCFCASGKRKQMKGAVRFFFFLFLRSLFNHYVHVRSAEAKRAHAGNSAPIFSRPISRFAHDLHV